MVFNLVAVAGTFDHLHLGHQKLLQTAKKSGRRVVVGLCQKSMLVNKPYLQSIESYSLRRLAVAQFRPGQIIPLSDIYGPALTSTAIEAIVCSPLSRPNVEAINHKRHLNNLNYLSIIEVPLVKASDGQPLSSSRIRQGLVNRDGFYYPQIFSKNLRLPQFLRSTLKRPFASIVKKITRPKFGTIAVGDIAAISLLNQKITPDLAIVDLKTKRQRIFPNLQAEGLPAGLTAINPPGTVTQNAVTKLLNCFSQKQPSLLIDGEEDLLVLPAILLAPLLTTIFYGQPDKGLVKITVTETTKAKALRFLQRFT